MRMTGVRSLAVLLAVCLVAAEAAAAAGDVEISPKGRRAIDAALAYLARTQNADGSWNSANYGKPTAIAALAGLAFMSDGRLPGRAQYGDNVSKAVDYVLRSAQPTGLLEYGTPHHAMYSHAFATLFLAEAWGMTSNADIKDKLKNAVDLIVRTQNREGGWRYEPKVADADISVTVCQIVALRAAANAGIAVPRETVDNAVGYLKKCERSDGGFAYQAGGGESAFPRSAGGLVSLVLAGGYDEPEVPRCVNYLKANANYTGQFWFYGQYYAAQAIHLAAAAEWPAWYSGATDRLTRRQSVDGSWTAANEDTGQCTAMGILILTIPNGYLPLYQR